MDRLRAIEYFIKVADLGSFTAAANAIGTPASSVSRRIQELEDSLGATLLHRTTRSVRLTELGAVYLEQVRIAVKDLDLAREIIRERPASPTGRIRITSNPGYGRLILLPALQKLRQTYPDLIIDVELTDQVYNLANNEVDIAVRATADLPDRAIARKLADSGAMLVAAPSYLAAHGKPVQLSDLAAHSHLLYRAPGRLIQWQARTEAGWSEVSPVPAFICNVGRVLVDEAVAGTGLSLLPAWGIAEELARGDLIALPLKDAELALSRQSDPGIYLLYNQPRYRLNKIKATVDFLVNAVAN